MWLGKSCGRQESVVPHTAKAGGEEFDYRTTAIIGAELVGVEKWFGRHGGASLRGAHGGVRWTVDRRLAREKSLPVNYAGGQRNNADLWMRQDRGLHRYRTSPSRAAERHALMPGGLK
jgi:hypothetical protein